MPQASRSHATTAQKMQEKEAKRARGVMSCAECRRLKLKCDKTVPCSSCKRRGCESICPNGSLITGQGTRFVLADTEKLHQKITHMSDRIRQLEDALFVLQGTVSDEPHPLLHRDLLHVKSSIDLHSAVESLDGPVDAEDPDEAQYIDAFGTLAIRDDGAATFYGRSAGSESLLIDEEASPSPPPTQRTSPNFAWDNSNSVANTIMNLSESFPFSPGVHGIGLHALADKFLPQWTEALKLCDFYLEQAPWFFGAVTRRQLHEEILPMWYPDSSGTPPSKGTAHDLALLFVIFCFGALTDNALPPAPDNAVAHQYFQLTRAALNLEPILDRTPSVATVQTLSLMAIYEGLCSGENSIERTWALMGLATKLAQSIGLHKDCARFKLQPAEVQKRRALFWELFITDCWQSLATGRLPSFALPFVDCELPYDSDQTMADDGSIQPSFPYWKARFGAECVSAVVQGTLTSRAPKYSIILRLDRQIRDMALPKYAQGAPPQGVGLSQTMQHFMPLNYRELTLLYIHRCFFAHAISSHPNDPLKSPYAPSFLAGYRSACELITGLEAQFTLFPSQIARFWVLWTHAFSSSVMLSSVVIRCTKNKVASAAMIELRKAHDLFQKASQLGGRAVKFYPIIQRLWNKAQKVYQDAHDGIHPPAPNDIFTLTSIHAKNDELSIFSGKTHYVITKVSSQSAPASGETSPSPPAVPSDDISQNPAFAGMHPSLIEQLQGFESHISAQIWRSHQEHTVHTSSTSSTHDPQHVSGSHSHNSQYQAHDHTVYATGMHPTHTEPEVNGHFEQLPPPAHHSTQTAYAYSRQPAASQPAPQPAVAVTYPPPHGPPPSVRNPPPAHTSVDRTYHHAPQPAARSFEPNPHPQPQPRTYHQHEHHHYHHTSHYPSQPEPSVPPPPYEAPPQQETPPIVSQSSIPPSHYPSQQVVQPVSSAPADHPHQAAHATATTHQQRRPSHYQPPIQQTSAQQSFAPSHNTSHKPPQHQYATHTTYSSDYPNQTHYVTHEPSQTIYSQSYSASPEEMVYHSPETSVDSSSRPSTSAATNYWQPAVSDESHHQQYCEYVDQYTSSQCVQPTASHHQHHPVQYTPVAALQGIAADDSGLQETWLAYMNQVGGAPRHLFDD